MKRIGITLITLLITVAALSGQNGENNQREEILKTMEKAAAFMVDSISYRGGYLWNYSADLSERYGEAPARETQIWVQGGTPEMGHLFLDLFEKTGNSTYLEYAEKAANALIYGQHPLGGWHYFIDFDKKGLEEWYEKVASRKLSGLEEYRHYYGNCTFDDNSTQSATSYLLRIYMLTLKPEYQRAVTKALDFILMAQYPNGGWPQRYPLHYEFAHDGFPDYTSFYTLNDNAMSNTIAVLLDAYQALGNESYLEAARRGGDFFMVAQGPEGQEGWAEQYNMDIQPVAARTHEPAGFMPRQTIRTVETLERLFLFTGDRRYLRPIPDAMEWLKRSSLKELENGKYEFARYYQPGTNVPVYVEFSGISDEGYQLYEITTNKDNSYEGWNWSYTIDMKSAVDQFEKVRSASSKEQQRELYRKLFGDEERDVQNPDTEKIEELINSINSEGAWIGDVRVWDYKPGRMIENRKVITGISTRTFISNMRTLMSGLE